MIYVRDKGRLCNNLLQFGHVYAWARANGRRAVSMRFAYKYPYFRICSTRGHNFLTYLFAKTAAKTGLLPVVSFNTPREADPENYDRNVEQMKRQKNVLVEGWEVRFYDLFLEYFDEIKALFGFTDAVRAAADRFFSDVPGSEGRFAELPADAPLRVGIHIRRGDYARWHEGRYLFDDRQIATVCLRIAEACPGRDIAFCLCGNDPRLDRAPYEALAKENPRLSFHFAVGNPGEDLCMLSRCQLLAGPPSTFSLVASMYRDTPLYWISDTESMPSFRPFTELFKEII